MTKQRKALPVHPLAHSSDCDCILCRRRHTAAPGAARGRCENVSTTEMPRLSEDGLSRFSTLDESFHGRKHKDTYCVLRPDLALYLDNAHDLARAAWSGLSDEERTCYLACVVEKLPQTACAQRLGLSQPTVSRRLRAARDALEACR